MKQVVQYYNAQHAPIVGRHAIVFTVDHPSSYTKNSPLTPVVTSLVQSVNGLTGEFETLNTKYIPRRDNP